MTAETRVKMANMDSSQYLIFIDTNILLDFYRGNKEANIKFLERLAPLRDRIITSCQVEMEFKKNRQRVMLESSKAIKGPDKIPTLLTFLNDDDSKQNLDDAHKQLTKQISNFQRRVNKALEQPTKHDAVYRLLHNLLSESGTGLNLRQDGSPVYNTIVDRARERYLLGYPPRKKDDTSCGDAINWEWMIECCRNTGKSLVIVSRDADYGVIHSEKVFVNDWLQQEFLSRVHSRCQITLVDRLSTALSRYANVKLSKDEVEAEQAQIDEVEERRRRIRELLISMSETALPNMAISVMQNFISTLL